MKRSLTIVGVFLLIAYGLVRNELAARVIMAVLIGLFLLVLLAAAAHWVWEGYSPAARRLRRGRERIVGPEGRARLPLASPPPAGRASLGPAFQLLSHRPQSRGARRGARR